MKKLLLVLALFSVAANAASPLRNHPEIVRKCDVIATGTANAFNSYVMGETFYNTCLTLSYSAGSC